MFRLIITRFTDIMKRTFIGVTRSRLTEYQSRTPEEFGEVVNEKAANPKEAVQEWEHYCIRNSIEYRRYAFTERREAMCYLLTMQTAEGWRIAVYYPSVKAYADEQNGMREYARALYFDRPKFKRLVNYGRGLHSGGQWRHGVNRANQRENPDVPVNADKDGTGLHKGEE